MSATELTSILPLLAEDAATKPVLTLPTAAQDTEIQSCDELPGYSLGVAELPDLRAKCKYPFDKLTPPVEGKASYFELPKEEPTASRLYSAVCSRKNRYPGEDYKVVPGANTVRVYRLA